MTGEDICPECGYDEGEHETECPIGSGHSREWWALLHRCEDPRWAVERITSLDAALLPLLAEIEQEIQSHEPGTTYTIARLADDVRKLLGGEG